MSVNAPPRLSGFARTISHACARRRPTHVPRRMHQAVARLRPLQIPDADLPQDRTRKKSGLDIPRPVVNNTLTGPGAVDTLLAEYAKRGDIKDFELLLSRASSDPPTEYQRDLHVKAHIIHSLLPTHSSERSTVQRFPVGALAVLHQYEASGHVAPIQSYTRVISALFNVQTYASSHPRLGRTAGQAHAWDLFSHMRYVAHPVPDAHLYALMIRACGSFSQPEPERALDLWTEMQENGIEPTKGTYEAVIRVCGRAGPEWLGEGLRLAREMSDRYSIAGMGGRGLWCALLEGCKRAGDLKKARWILAEVVRGGRTSGESPVVDSELMTHVFHTYASYKPPFSREATRLVDDSAAANDGASTNKTLAHPSNDSDLSPDEISDQSDAYSDVPVESVPSFSRLPPQTSSEVIAETRILFDRILQDRSLSPEAHQSSRDGMLAGVFANVELTPVLANAYLSVFYSHASIEIAQEAFESVFGQSDSFDTAALHPDEHAHVHALESCAIAPVEDRHLAARWAKDVWQRWEVRETKCVKDGKISIGSLARLIEKAHAAMRRVLILSGDVDGALVLLRSFVAQYPPSAVLNPSHPAPPPSKLTTIPLFAKPPILSTRTVLTNATSLESSTARPLVRLTSAASVKDDRVPPIIAFGDVDLLHTRLAEHGRVKDLGYVKWVCMAYAGALRRRREAVLGSVSQRGSSLIRK